MKHDNSLRLLVTTVLIVAFSHVNEASQTIDLSSNWTLVNDEFGIKLGNISIPNSVHSILLANELINDPLDGFNDVNFRWIVYADAWTLIKQFFLNERLAAQSHVALVLDSVDTFAGVYLNGKNVLNTSNQFVRYEIVDVRGVLVSGWNTLEIRFESSVKKAKQLADEYPYKIPPTCPPKVQRGECQVNFLRKQQCSFSWDWGPAFAPIGINGPVQLNLLDTTSNSNDFNFDFSVSVYPRDAQSPSLIWLLDIELVVNQSSSTSFNSMAQLQTQIQQLPFYQLLNLSLPGQNSRQRLSIEVGEIPDESLWWPAGHGKQPLYELKLSLTTPGAKQPVKKSKIIGFRLVELIQKPVDSNQLHGLTFYFSINKRPIFLKGSNWIPADSFQEQITSYKLNWLLRSTVGANMNVLRVWGGGVYEKDEFYDLADQMGIMIWQDFMFACGTYPTNSEFLNNVALEVEYQVNRLRHHPSIIVWAGNNENEAAISTNWYGTDVDRPRYTNDYRQLYVKTIMPMVESLDPSASRPFLASSPTNGVESIQENWLAKNPYDLKYGDLHFYDYKMNGWLPESFPVPRFMSEYGVQSMPSLATLANAYSFPQDADFFGTLNTHREHHDNGLNEIQQEIENNLKMPSDSMTPIEKFRSIIYFSQINQAMHYKTGIEVFRRARNRLDPETGHGYCMGSMYWQLNDLWQAPTWSTIEYHKDAGKWKMAHYYAKLAYAPLLISPVINQTSQAIDFYAISDFPTKTSGRFELRVHAYDSFDARYSRWYDFSIDSLMSAPVLSMPMAALEKLTGCRFGWTYSCLITIGSDDGDPSGSSNFMFFSTRLADVTNLNVTSVTIDSVDRLEAGRFSVRVRTDRVALFVWLDITTTRFVGVFSDNGFHMITTNRTVTFTTDNVQLDVETLAKHLTVQTLVNSFGST